MLTNIEYTNWIVKIGTHEHKFLDKEPAEKFYESVKDLKLTKVYLFERNVTQEVLKENSLVSTFS